MTPISFQIAIEDYIQLNYLPLRYEQIEELWLYLEQMNFIGGSSADAMNHLELKFPWIPCIANQLNHLLKLNKYDHLPIQFNKNLFDEFRSYLISQQLATEKRCSVPLQT
jgi:hypothetical protein